MLVVLAEINCLSSLQKKGVYPDEFYTDLEMFKNRAVFMKNATILVIFAGNCRFQKRHTLEFVKTLMKRADAQTDSGINRVYIVSDMTLAGIRSYYKYVGTFDSVDIMHGWSCVKSGVDIWRRLQTEKREATCYLSQMDKGVTDHLVETCQEEAKVVDEYVKLIQIPNLREMFAMAGPA